VNNWLLTLKKQHQKEIDVIQSEVSLHLKKLHSQHKKNLDTQKEQLTSENEKLNAAYVELKKQFETLSKDHVDQQSKIHSQKQDAKSFVQSANKESEQRVLELEKKISEHENTIKTLGDTVSKLKAEIEQLQKSLAEKDKKIRELAATEKERVKLEKKLGEHKTLKSSPETTIPSSIVDNSEELEKLREQLVQDQIRAEDEKKQLAVQIEKLRQEIKEKTSKLESVLNKGDNLSDEKLLFLEQELSKARTRCEELEKGTSKANKELVEWKSKYETLEKTPKSSPVDQKKLVDLENDVKQWETKYKQLQNDSSSMKQLQHELDAWKEKFEHKQQEITSLRKEYTSEDTDERVRVMQEHLKKLEAELEEKIDVLEKTRANHEQSELNLKEAQDKLKQNENAIESFKNKIFDLEKDKTTSSEEVDKFKRLLMKYKSGTNKLKQDSENAQKTFNEEKEALNLAMKRVTDELVVANEKLKPLNDEVDTLRSRVKELESGKQVSASSKDLEEMSKKLKKAIADKDEATQTLQATINELTEKNKSLSSAKDKHTQGSTSEIEKLKQQATKKDQERKEMEQQLHSLVSEKEKIIQGLKTKDEQTTKRITELESQIEALQKTLRKTNDKNSDESKRAAALEQEIATLSTKVTTTKDELTSYKNKATEFESLLEKANKQIEALQNKYNELDRLTRQSTQDQTTKFEEKLKQLKQEYETKLNELAAEKQAECERLTIKLSVAEQEKVSLEKNLLQVNERATTLQRQVDTLTDAKNKFEPIRKRAELADQLEKDIEENKKQIALEKKRFAELETQFRESEAMRRKLYNEREDAKGKIRVYARCRPMSSVEKQNGYAHCIGFIDESTLRIIPKKQDFAFNRVFNDNSTQEEVFEDTKDLVQSSLDGYNVCIFAYGQTGSGKTHTIAGGDTQEMEGLVPKAMRHVFNLINKNKKVFKYTVQCCMIELYMDDLYDLFAKKDKKQGNMTQAKSSDLEIKKDKNGNVVVAGIEMRDAETYEELSEIYRSGEKNRHVRSTKMNAVSSRSHLVFSIYISGVNLSSGEKSFGKLTMVDLAGSENRKKTQITEEKGNQEALSINKSLLALGDVISALSEKKTFVPYRNNKLTMLLSDSLGGNAKTLMFVCIGPAEYNADESSTSLKYATRVKAITNNVNRQAETKEIQRLKKIIEKLRNSSNPAEVEVEDETIGDITETAKAD
jgi:chromosome segregation ATPase